MAVITRNISNIAELTGDDFILELEYIEFIDDAGNHRKFKISGLCPISVIDCRRVSPATEWDDKNFHFVIDVDANNEIP